MTTDKFTEKISLWLDNELSPAEVTELQAHLAGCPECRQTYRAMRQIEQLFRAAARQMAAPRPGFTRRVEARLAQHRPVRSWQIWLTLGALLAGTVALFSAWAIIGGIALLGVRASVLDAGLYYQGLVGFIETIDNVRLYFNLGLLFLKASLITMSQPLFWLCVLFAIGMAGLWLRVMGRLSRGSTPNGQLLF